MRARRARRALAATAVTTAALLLWWRLSASVPTESNAVPWTVLGLLLATATVLSDRLTRPFVGVATTAAAAALAYLLSATWAGGQGLWAVLELVLVPLQVAVGAAAVAGAASGLHLLHRRLPRPQRPWAVGVVLLGASSWAGWCSWWILNQDSPAGWPWLAGGAIASLLLGTAVGEVVLGRWLGLVLALGSAALLAVAPLAASDAFGLIVWFVLSAIAGAGCLVVVGAVAAVRGARRHLPAAAR
ncbi:hypothetical protein [Kineococcus terrestris]|uniref:hypothetical protein n=1 Tax=Kineococcus terrestris TaxID=2044856 RepID=UPI0034DAC029